MHFSKIPKNFLFLFFGRWLVLAIILLLVFLGDTWKDGGAVDLRREVKGLTWGVGWEG